MQCGTMFARIQQLNRPMTKSVFLLTTCATILINGATSVSGASADFRFSAPLRLPLGVPPGGVAVGDFNGDGRMDISAGHNIGAWPNFPARVAVFLNQTSNIFSSPAILTPGPTCWMADSVETADLNGDGIKDLLISVGGTASGCFGNHFVSMLGNGAGSFAEPGLDHTTGGSPGNPGIGDFNGDGVPDVAFVTADARTLRLHRGLGNGTFAPWTTTPLVSEVRAVIAVARLDEDPFLDVVTSSYASNVVEVFFGAGDGTFAPSVQLPVPNGYYVATGDLNNDRLLDIVVTSYTAPGMVSVFLNSGNRRFSSPWTMTLQSGELGGLSLGDLNCDGQLDAVVASNDGSLSLLAVCAPVTLIAHRRCPSHRNSTGTRSPNPNDSHTIQRWRIERNARMTPSTIVTMSAMAIVTISARKSQGE